MLETLQAPATDTPLLSDDELLAAFEQGWIEHRRIEARNAALLAEIDRRRAYQPYGYLSTTAYVAHATSESQQAAAGEVRVARGPHRDARNRSRLHRG